MFALEDQIEGSIYTTDILRIVLLWEIVWTSYLEVAAHQTLPNATADHTEEAHGEQEEHYSDYEKI